MFDLARSYPPRVGLRERKKQATRQAIAEIATDLFERLGYDAVSISEVAAEAGVAKMTVTNHFARKEDLVFDRAAQVVAELAEKVRHRPAGQTPLDAIRDGYLDAVARQHPTAGFMRPSFAAMLDGSPALRARYREMMEQREAALAEALREEGVPALSARFAAAQLAAVDRILFAEAIRLTLAGRTRDEVQQILHAAATTMYAALAHQPSLGDLRRAGG
jgi:AcrR family transcriptional regulator